MTVRIEIEDTGQWFEVKDADELTHGDLKAVAGATPLEVDPDNRRFVMPGNSDDLTVDMLAARSLTNWNLPHPLPKGDPNRLDVLTPKQHKALKAGLAEHIKLINAERVDPDAEDSVPTNG